MFLVISSSFYEIEHSSRNLQFVGSKKSHDVPTCLIYVTCAKVCVPSISWCCPSPGTWISAISIIDPRRRPGHGLA